MRNAASAVLTNSKGREVLVIGGGEDESSRTQSEVYTHDGINRIYLRRKRSWSWNDISDIPEPVSGHCFVKINSSSLLSIGGKDELGNEIKYTYFYNEELKNWSVGPPLDIPRVNLSCGLLNWKNPKTNKIVKIVVAGGGSNKNNKHLHSVELLHLDVDDSSTEKWVSGPPLPVEIVTAMVDYNNTVIAIGKSENAEYNQLYELTSPTGEWTIRSDDKVHSSENKQLAFLVPEEILDHIFNI